MSIKEILKLPQEQKVSIKGWVVSNRGNNKIRFLTVNDGSTINNIQVVIKNASKELDLLRNGSAIFIEGVFHLTPNRNQKGEVIPSNVSILKNVDLDYPLQKKVMSKEFLRDIPHLRQRTNLFKAVMRIRSTLSQEIHNFFAKRNFLLLASPIITSNDGEGAGETFIVDDEKQNFFGKKATLGVTGQLHAEAYALGFKKVYTFAPTFRAEYSNTKRHAAEFWMIEPEVAFYDLKKIINLADSMLKTVLQKTMEKQKQEFAFLNENVEENLLAKLENVVKNKITILDYKDAIKELQKVKDYFENQDIHFGIDLASEHEKYLAEKFVKGPVAIINFPKEIKAFYMHLNKDQKTVAAFDILVPGIGELIGGSQREANVEKLVQRMKDLNISQEDLQWYLDLRRFGLSLSSGFGLGFERLVMYATGVTNIRDAIPFPRTPKNLKM